MLFNGEKLGRGCEPSVDIAVDPIDGTRLTSLGLPNAVSVVAFADRGSMYDPKHIFYMDKIATGPESAGAMTATCTPSKTAFADARMATSVFPKPTSPTSRRSIGTGRAMSRPTSSMARSWSSVSLYGKVRSNSLSCSPSPVKACPSESSRLAYRSIR